MKKLIVILMALILPLSIVSAKNSKSIERDLQEFKIKYLAQEMELRNDQKDKFVEIYSRMTDEKRKVFGPAIKMHKKVQNGAGVTKEEYQKANDMMNRAKSQEVTIDQKYEGEFRKFLSAKQIYKMREAEKKFRKMLKDARNKKH